MIRVQVQEAKAKLSEMLERAIQGENIIITKHGKDTAVIIGMESFQLLYPQPATSAWEALQDDNDLLDNEEVERLFARDSRPVTAKITFEELE